MKDINAERLEALEWAIEAGHVITRERGGFFIATSDVDGGRALAANGSLRTLADELARIKARMETNL